MSLDRILRALLALPPGFIEVRVIEDKRGGDLVDRRFYASVDELVGDLDRLMALSHHRAAGVFFGVLPRRKKGKGKSEDVLPGLVVWADLDFKDYQGREEEARRRLEAFPIRPSLVVRSGHGLHVYWLLREPTDPSELSQLSRATAQVLGGDHAFDAARILRLPETHNRKDPENPLLVEVEHFDPALAYNASEISEALDLVGWKPVEPASTRKEAARVTPASMNTGGPLSERIQGLIHRNSHIQSRFWGRGKPPLGRDGRSLDPSSSGYDFSLVMALLRKGVDDPAELANAIHNRPDEAARAKGPEYIARTVRAAMERFQAAHEAQGRAAKAPSNPADVIDFVVEHVRILSSDPARYELTIDGKPMQLTSSQLKSSSSFATRFLDALKRLPRLPRTGWHDLVNDWLRGAEVIEAPPEASTHLAVVEAVREAIGDLRLTDDPSDLHRSGAAYLLDADTAFFRLGPLLKALREDHPDLTRPMLCWVLRDVGWRDARRTLAGREVRGWVGPATDVHYAREDTRGECA